jgi:hypothetical protein
MEDDIDGCCDGTAKASSSAGQDDSDDKDDTTNMAGKLLRSRWCVLHRSSGNNINGNSNENIDASNNGNSNTTTNKL